MMSEDKENQHRVYHVDQGNIDWTHAKQRVRSYIEFSWTVYSSSLYSLRFGQKPTGKVKYMSALQKNAADISLDPEISSRTDAILKNLHRTHNGRLFLKQYIPPDVRKDLELNFGRTVTFDFEDIRFPVTTLTPDGKPGPDWKIMIPTTWVVELQVPEGWESSF